MSLGGWPRTLGLALVVGVCARNARADEKRACVAEAEEAQQVRREHRLRAAHELLILCAQASCPAVVRTDCERWLSEVEAVEPSVVFRVRDERGATIEGVTIDVDGRTVARGVGSEPTTLDPGTHVVHLQAQGFVSTDLDVVLREGDSRRVVSAILEREAAPVPAPSAADSGSPHGPAKPDAPGPSPTPASGTPVLAWTVGGTGVAAMGVGGILWALGTGGRSALYSRCGQPGTCSTADIDAQESSVRAKLVAGDLCVGAGVIAVGVSIALFAKTRGATRVTPGRGGAILGYATPF